MPPGLVKRSRSLLKRERSDGASRNPFLGTSKSILRNRKRQTNDPFADEQADQIAIDMDAGGAEELSQHDVDDFFEIERPDSMVLMDSQTNGKEGKNWSRFRPSKEKKGKKKHGKGRLGSGAEIVAQPKDAFPNAPEPEQSEID